MILLCAKVIDTSSNACYSIVILVFGVVNEVFHDFVMMIHLVGFLEHGLWTASITTKSHKAF